MGETRNILQGTAVIIRLVTCQQPERQQATVILVATPLRLSLWNERLFDEGEEEGKD